jgi:hypothetical protein
VKVVSAVTEPMVMVSRVMMRAHSWMAIDFVIVIANMLRV